MNRIERQAIINDTFMQLSKDDSTKVSASIFNDNGNLVAIGYNGLPRGFKENNIDFVRDKEAIIIYWKEILKKSNDVETYDDFYRVFKESDIVLYKYDFFEHAERNLIYNLLNRDNDIRQNVAITNNIETPEDARALISSGMSIVKSAKIASVGDDDLINNIETLYNYCAIRIMFELSNVKLNHELNTKFFRYEKALLETIEKINMENYCAIFKPDFSLLSLGFDEENPIAKTKHKFSAVLNSIYQLAHETLNTRNTKYKMHVSMCPCRDCCLSIAAMGDSIESVDISMSSQNARTNKRWLDEFNENKKLLNNPKINKNNDNVQIVMKSEFDEIYNKPKTSKKAINK